MPRNVNYIDYASDSDSTIAIFFLQFFSTEIFSASSNNLADGYQLTEQCLLDYVLTTSASGDSQLDERMSGVEPTISNYAR